MGVNGPWSFNADVRAAEDADMLTIGTCLIIEFTELSFWLLGVSIASLELSDRASMSCLIRYAVSSNQGAQRYSSLEL